MQNTKQALVQAEKAARSCLGAVGAALHELRDESVYGRQVDHGAACEKLRIAIEEADRLKRAAKFAITQLEPTEPPQEAA